MKFGGFFIAAAFVLSACSGDPQPREPEPTSTASPSSTATPPAMPAQASEDSPEGAAAFVNYWVDALNYAAATGDTELLEEMSKPSCSTCQSYIGTFADTYENGGYFRDADWTVGEITLRESGVETYATFVAKAESGPYRLSADSPEKFSTGTDNKVTLAISHTDDRWLASQLGLGDVE